jgi:hypothetical protein
MTTEFTSRTPAEGDVIEAERAEFGPDALTASFTVEATIDDSKIRYRQYVKGYYSYNGRDLEHFLGDELLDRNTYKEDKKARAFDVIVYGDRTTNIRWLSEYKLEGETETFIAHDNPNVQINPEDFEKVSMKLEFIGVLCHADKTIEPNGDLEDNPDVHKIRRWTVRGECTS